jgi:hypothetical protein
LLFFTFVGVGIVVNLASLIREMVHRSAGIDGLQLLSSSIAVWVVNVLGFSVLYWEMDRGGPEARANWKVDSAGDVWTIPLRLSVSKVVKFGTSSQVRSCGTVYGSSPGYFWPEMEYPVHDGPCHPEVNQGQPFWWVNRE